MNFIEAIRVNGKARYKGWGVPSIIVKRNTFGFCRYDLLSGSHISKFPENVNDTEQLLSDDWEPYIEPPKTYDFVTAIKNFPKIRRLAWSNNLFLCNSDNSIFFIENTFIRDGMRLRVSDVVAHDWIEIKDS